jgi:hypothetical protein
LKPTLTVTGSKNISFMSAPFSKTISIGTKTVFPGPERKESLSIELLPDGFSFCILDHQHFRYLALESYRAAEPLTPAQWGGALDQLVKENPLLTAPYERISISWCSPQLILMPFELFLHSEKEAYYKFGNNLPEQHQVMSDRLNNLQAYGLYPFPKEVKKSLDFLFPSHRLRHSGTVLIESLLASLHLGEWHAGIVLHIRKQHFDVLLFEDNKLRFFNSFRYQEFGDLMYYLFFVLEQFELDANTMDAILLGEISLDSERYQTLSQYFNHATFLGRSDVYRYNPDFDALPHHYFYNLFNLNSCG